MTAYAVGAKRQEIVVQLQQDWLLTDRAIARMLHCANELVAVVRAEHPELAPQANGYVGPTQPLERHEAGGRAARGVKPTGEPTKAQQAAAGAAERKVAREAEKAWRVKVAADLRGQEPPTPICAHARAVQVDTAFHFGARSQISGAFHKSVPIPRIELAPGKSAHAQARTDGHLALAQIELDRVALRRAARDHRTARADPLDDRVDL